MDGYVYAMYDPATMLTKIGASMNPTKRLTQLSRKGRGLVLLRTWEAQWMLVKENQVHWLMSQYRHHGEWFRLCMDDLDHIGRYLQNIPEPVKPIVTEEPTVQCPKCEYKWASRAAQPKQCPNCKKRLDWSKHTYCTDPRESFVLPLPDKGEVGDNSDLG